jgi:hypothetical protein
MTEAYFYMPPSFVLKLKIKHMSKKFTFKAGASDGYAVVPYRKKNISILRIYPLLYHVKTNRPFRGNEYDKKDALLTLKFEGLESIGTFIGTLLTMRDDQVYRNGESAGRRAAKEDVKSDSTLKDLLGDVMNGMDEMSEVIAMFSGDNKNSKSLKDMPKETFDMLFQMLFKDKERREKEKEGNKTFC